jgi:hypothetical protein
MVDKKNWIKLIIALTTTIIASILLIVFSIIDTDKILLQGNDFQYNAISMSAIIGGFLFTGISILISAIENERIKRLWDNKYLDNLYRASFIGMISNVITIVAAFILLCFCLNKHLQYFMVCIEIITIIVGIVFFVWCIKQLMFILTRMKNDKK